MPKAAPDSPFKFSRNSRLLIKKDFQPVFANPRKTSYRYLLVLYRPNQRLDARLGIVIAKNRVKKAVDRNLIRRIIRESFRHQRQALKGLDLIILLRSECTPILGEKADKKALRNDVDGLWQRLIDSYKPV